MLYVVSYTLQPPRIILPLVTELQSNPDWAHYLDSTWLIATTETAQQLYERLGKHLTVLDFILIIEIKRNSSRFGYLPKDAWEWLDQRGAAWAAY